MPRGPPIATLFPYTTLFRSIGRAIRMQDNFRNLLDKYDHTVKKIPKVDRKSTRLNSSHRCISYAVSCLKKKNDNHAPCAWLNRNRHKTKSLPPCSTKSPLSP